MLAEGGCEVCSPAIPGIFTDSSTIQATNPLLRPLAITSALLLFCLLIPAVVLIALCAMELGDSLPTSKEKRRRRCIFTTMLVAILLLAGVSVSTLVVALFFPY